MTPVNFGVFICSLLHRLPMRAWFVIINLPPIKINSLHRQIYLDISDFNMTGVLILGFLLLLSLVSPALVSAYFLRQCWPTTTLWKNIYSYFPSCLPIDFSLCSSGFYIELTPYWLPLGDRVTGEVIGLSSLPIPLLFDSVFASIRESCYFTISL